MTSSSKSAALNRTVVLGADEAHCCDSSQSLRLLIDWHRKATCGECGCSHSLTLEILYSEDVLQYSYGNQAFHLTVLVICSSNSYESRTYDHKKDLLQ